MDAIEMQLNVIKDEIRQFVMANLVVFAHEVNISDNDNYFELGYVNSLFSMKLVKFIEKEFDIEIPNEELDMKNFYSIRRTAEFVQEQIGQCQYVNHDAVSAFLFKEVVCNLIKHKMSKQLGQIQILIEAFQRL